MDKGMARFHGPRW